MHGRMKVRSTAEQEEVKRKEKEEKVKDYQIVTARIYEKRSSGERDDEALKLTREVLSQNPEVTTFWNYRREILQERQQASSPEEFTALCKKELSLLETCLMVNPKAYGVWLHREWVLTTVPVPDWKHEKSLCDLFLKYDERNFHCWDYRRFVNSKSENFTLKEEFEFTYDKIAANFSNYSAWHYRSKLLPKLHPSTEVEGGVAEEALHKEYELAQNAFFTDPSDQSAWLYHRWLLGKVDKPVQLACVLVRPSPTPVVYVVFNQPIKVTLPKPIQISVGSTPVINPSTSDWPESLYVCPVPDLEEETAVKVVFGELEATVTVAKGEETSWWVNGVEAMFGSSLTAATTSVLQSELQSCQELLEMEPDNKWCVLTVMLLMQALNAHKYSAAIAEMSKKLTAIDPYRKGYYSDLLSKFVTEQLLRETFKDLESSQRTLDLSCRNLSRLDYPEHMILFQTVNLSNNQLVTLSAQVARSLASVHTLVLDGNRLKALPRELGQINTLRVLSLKENNISDLSSIEECLSELNGLQVLNLQGNPLSGLEGDELLRQVKQLVPGLMELNGERC